MDDFGQNEDFLSEGEDLGGEPGGQSGKKEKKDKEPKKTAEKGVKKAAEKDIEKSGITGLLSLLGASAAGYALIVVFVIVVIGAIIAVFVGVSGADISTPGGGAGSCGSQTTALPINGEPSTYNVTPHGRSISSPGDDSGHNTILRKSQTYGASNLNNTLGEAVDIYFSAGSPVFAPFDGTIIHSQDIGFNTGDFIIIESKDSCLVAALAHLTPGQHPTSGEVTTGSSVGDLCSCLRQPHLHFELWVTGEPVNIGGPISGYSSKHSKQIWEKQKEALGS